MADDLVIMVGRNHIFVEDQMKRRSLIESKKNMIPLNVAYSYFASSLCVFYLRLPDSTVVSIIIYYKIKLIISLLVVYRLLRALK